MINGVGERGQVLLFLSDIAGVYAVEASLSYDFDILTVVDAAPSTFGVQVQPGSCPNPQSVAVNLADVTEGTIAYAVTQVGQTASCDGGTVLIIEFECLAVGTSNLSVDSVVILDRNAQTIDTLVEDGTITCQP